MKTLKVLFAIAIISTMIISCKENKKETEDEATDIIEAVDETPKEDADKPEEAGFTYSVNYPSDQELADKVDAAMKDLLENYSDLEPYFKNAYGYAVFHNITKVGIGIGGAGGSGLVFQNNAVIGKAKMSQATIGLQLGGQTYKQVIFFEDKEALYNFTNGKFKFSTGVSAVAVKKGVSTDVVYQDGVAVIGEGEKGLMAEASIGTQKFKYEAGN